MEFFEKPGTSLIVAKSGSGKSTLVSNIVAHLTKKRIIQGILIFSTTAKGNSDYQFVDKSYLVMEMLDIKLLLHIMAIRAKAKASGQTVNNLLIILDDILGEKDIRSKEMESLISKARHYNMFILISVQFVNAIPPSVRQNANVVAITKLSNKAELDYMYDLCGYPGTKQEFNEMMQKEVGLYEFFLTNRYSPSKKIEDQHKIIRTTDKIPKIKWV